jgi:hypothetical protein
MLIRTLILMFVIFLTSCSAGTNYSNECLWYQPVKFSDQTKRLLEIAEPGSQVLEDLKQILYNNEMFNELC